MSAAFMSASFSHVRPSPSRAVGPTTSGLPRDIVASGSSFGVRSYRLSSTFFWSAMTFGFSSLSSFSSSCGDCFGFFASSGSREKSNPSIRPFSGCWSRAGEIGGAFSGSNTPDRSCFDFFCSGRSAGTS